MTSSYLKQLKNNTGYALLISLIVTLVLTFIMGAASMRSHIQLAQTNQRQAVQEAFYAADSGIERAVYELRNNPLWSPGENSQPPLVDVRLNRVIDDDTTTIGFYSLETADGAILENFGETKWIKSIGRDSFNKMTRVIMARALIDNPARFIITTPETIKLKSGAVVNSDILGNKVQFDINTGLPPEDRGILVDGDVLYISELNPTDPEANPDITINGDIQEYPSVTLPGVDLPHYQNIAQSHEPLQGYFTDGNLTIDLSNLNSLNPDANFEPLIIYAEGDVTISGQYPHSILIVAGGNIYIDGDIEADPNHGLALRPDTGIIAKKYVIIADGAASPGADLTISDAMIMADGGDEAKGRFYSQSTSALGDLNFRGSISVKGEKDNEDDPDEAIDLNVFATRNYEHDPNLKVPFGPFIVKIIEWKMTTLQEPFPPVEE